MKRITIATAGVFLFALGTASRAFSNEIVDSQLQAKTYKGIPYISGGFGVEERENLRAMGKADNLELSFALQDKDYLGGAEVLIKDRNGREVLETASDGPLFFAKLPEGIYTVEATAMGKTLEQVAHLPSKGQARLYFAWKDSIASHTTGVFIKKQT
jgi:hypothetical protein